jgi:hypothetical protein
MGKLNHHAEKMSPGGGLPEYVVHGIGSGRLRPLNQCLPKAKLLDFTGLNSMTRYVVNSICRPDEFVNLHSAILDEQSAGNNESANLLFETASIPTAAAHDPAPAQ